MNPSPIRTSRQVWLPPLRFSLPLMMLASGLVLISLETALFLAFHERWALDDIQGRVLRDGTRLVRLFGQLPSSDFEKELEAARSENGVRRIYITEGPAHVGTSLIRDDKGGEVVAQFALPTQGLDRTDLAGSRILHLHLDLEGPLGKAKDAAIKQALATAAVLGIGSLLLWIVLDATIAQRAESIVANARSITEGDPPKAEVGGEDELAQIDRALREAHLTIQQQATDLHARAMLLAEKNEERNRLQQEILQISESEQQRIGQDLHDDVCQRLAAVRMKIQDHEEKLAEIAPRLLPDAEAIASDLAGAIHITRTLARGLSPVAIGSGGLDAALKGLTKAAEDMFGVSCEFVSDDPIPPLRQESAHQLYRIAQECIANAAKHAKARLIRVSVSHAKDRLILRIRNDGDPMKKEAESGDGMGMTIMRHRAESMGAELIVDTHPSDGTTAIRCTLNLAPPSIHALI